MLKAIGNDWHSEQRYLINSIIEIYYKLLSNGFSIIGDAHRFFNNSKNPYACQSQADEFQYSEYEKTKTIQWIISNYYVIYFSLFHLFWHFCCCRCCCYFASLVILWWNIENHQQKRWTQKNQVPSITTIILHISTCWIDVPSDILF